MKAGEPKLKKDVQGYEVRHCAKCFGTVCSAFVLLLGLAIIGVIAVFFLIAKQGFTYDKLYAILGCIIAGIFFFIGAKIFAGLEDYMWWKQYEWEYTKENFIDKFRKPQQKEQPHNETTQN